MLRSLLTCPSSVLVDHCYGRRVQDPYRPVEVRAVLSDRRAPAVPNES